ncbi:MAG: hypothetical protein DCF30_15695 [Hyphomicrobiales bacterium]|nr:MAG: hypothetical protein DCF30_15695 [Hyphomicrobiales bacterium]
MRFSPGVGADWWLLGIGFIEISAIAGAIEIIVGALRTRAPNMTLARMPVFAWTMLIFSTLGGLAFQSDRRPTDPGTEDALPGPLHALQPIPVWA